MPLKNYSHHRSGMVAVQDENCDKNIFLKKEYLYQFFFTFIINSYPLNSSKMNYKINLACCCSLLTTVFVSCSGIAFQP